MIDFREWSEDEKVCQPQKDSNWEDKELELITLMNLILSYYGFCQMNNRCPKFDVNKRRISWTIH